MPISQETIQAVQHNVNIAEVIAAFIPLKKKGQNLWACCPFHHEKTPSFAVSPTKGFYKCFGCDAAGDAITFVQEMEGLSFVEAIKYLATRYGIPIQTSAVAETAPQQQYEQDSLYILLNMAKEYYTHVLWHHPEGQHIGLRYLKERGITAFYSKKFDLGYSLNAWEDFYHFAKKKGYHDARLEQAGLIIQKESKTYDRFRGRLIFPIHNVSGKVVAFGARRLTVANNQPKYINSPETIVYHKRDVLYGLYHAKQKVRQEDHCYLVEGYTDVLALHRAGIENVVASSGTSLTEAQLQLMSRFTKHVTILFDGDVAGVKAALRGINMVLEKGLQVKVVLFPEGEDPDSYAQKQGTTALQDYLRAQAQDFITFKAKLCMQTVQEDPIQKASAIKDIIQSIAVIPDAVQRAVFTKQCSKLLAIEEAVLQAEQHKLLAQQAPQWRARQSLRLDTTAMTVAPTEALPYSYSLTDSIEAYERESIRLLLNYGTVKIADNKPLYEYLLCELADVHFRTPKYKMILAQFQAQLAQGKVVDATYFIQSQDTTIKKTAIDLTASLYDISDQWKARYQIDVKKEEDQLHQAAFKNILRLKLRLIQQLIEDNRAGLKHNCKVAEEEKLLKIHATLKQAEAKIAQQLGMVVVR